MTDPGHNTTWAETGTGTGAGTWTNDALPAVPAPRLIDHPTWERLGLMTVGLVLGFVLTVPGAIGVIALTGSMFAHPQWFPDGAPAVVAANGAELAFGAVNGGITVEGPLVPAGTWVVLASFDGGPEVVAGTVDLGFGEQVSLTCEAATARCTR